MKLSQLAFIVTDDCNFRCSYCLQKKQNSYISPAAIQKAINFFYPTLKENAYLIFYGGEPLLAFDTIQYAVSLVKKKEKENKKNIHFSLTTNGSLVSEEMLTFFNRNRFQLMLSFDGPAQETGRHKGSLETCKRLIQKIQEGRFPNIQFSINSVFSPQTVPFLSSSLQAIIRPSVNESDGDIDINFDLAENLPWDDRSCSILAKQLADVTHFLVSYYKETGIIPVESYRNAKEQSNLTSKTTFACAAGKSRMAISPQEDVWGCHVFHGVFRDKQEHPDYEAYRFGKLDEFIANYNWLYPRGMYYYDCLSQEYFSTGDTQCFFCREVNDCRVCPANAAISTSSVGNISPWVCRLNRIQKKEKIRFLRDTEGIPSLSRRETLIYGNVKSNMKEL